MEGKAERICEAYHVHDEGDEDEMMDDDMPDENHDKGGMLMAMTTIWMVMVARRRSRSWRSLRR